MGPTDISVIGCNALRTCCKLKPVQGSRTMYFECCNAHFLQTDNAADANQFYKKATDKNH